MSGLKLTMAMTTTTTATTTTSIRGNPYKLVRTLATNNHHHQLCTYSSFPPLSSSSSSFSPLTLIRQTTTDTHNKSSIPRTPIANHLGFRSSSYRFESRYSQQGRGGGGGGGETDSSSSFIPNNYNKMGSVDKDDDGHKKQQQQPLLVPQQKQSSSHHHQHSTKLLTLPTILTLGRVAAVPLLVSTFYVNSRWGTTATTSIFIAAAITDWLDGYIARKMRLGTAFGAFLDPVADKLMVAATLILLCTRPSNIDMFGNVPWLLSAPSIAIIGREITMSAVREWAASQNAKLLEAVAVNNLGKWKTASQMTALTILLATRDSSLVGPGALAASGVVLLYISAGLALWSLAVYMRKISKVLLK